MALVTRMESVFEDMVQKLDLGSYWGSEVSVKVSVE